MSRWRVPLADVAVSDELLTAAREAVASGWWSMGPRVEEFETRFAEFSGVEHALAVANGTAALHLALLALECGQGDEVIVPSLNFVAAANTVTHTGARPVFCDILGDDDLTLDPADVEAAITPRTKALIVMHYGGFACRMPEVLELADRHGIAVIEDAAHAPGATLGGRPLGSFGAVSCFSFFSNKNMPVGEGGAVTTSDPDLAAKLRLLRSHGMTTLTWDRHRGHAHSYDVVLPGFNYRLDELRAAMAIVQLGRLPAENAARREVAARYRSALHGVAGYAMPFDDAEAQRESSHHLAIVLVSDAASRDDVRTALAGRGIQTSVHYPPIHEFSYYAPLSSRSLPRTSDVASRLITLPLYGTMRDEDVDAVVGALLEVADAAAA